jgi:hypothetical protein
MAITGFDKIAHSAQGEYSFNALEIVNLLLSQRFDMPASKLRTCERQELVHRKHLRAY